MDNKLTVEVQVEGFYIVSEHYINVMPLNFCSSPVFNKNAVLIFGHINYTSVY